MAPKLWCGAWVILTVFHFAAHKQQSWHHFCMSCCKPIQYTHSLPQLTLHPVQNLATDVPFMHLPQQFSPADTWYHYDSVVLTLPSWCPPNTGEAHHAPATAFVGFGFVFRRCQHNGTVLVRRQTHCVASLTSKTELAGRNFL